MKLTGSDWILENKSLSGCKWGKNLAMTEEESGKGVWSYDVCLISY